MEHMASVKIMRLLSWIFMAIWFFMCVVITMGFLVESSDESTGSNVVSLIFSYILFSAMFLVPAITMSQAKNAVKKGESESCSEKSYWITLLLSVFLGVLGIHRFYVGKKITGALYLLTLGGLIIGWVVDVILVVTGMFLDKNGQFIRRPAQNKQKQNFRPNDPQKRETVKRIPSVQDLQKKKEQTREQTEHQPVQTAVFSDVVVLGTAEKRQEIPARPSNSLRQTLSESPPPATTHTVEATRTMDTPDIRISYSGDWRRDKFFDDMKKYADTVGKKAKFVPFMQYWPTYDNMDSRQRAWYFYWRTQVRNGQYPDTDLSYIFVHVYELLSGCGWKQASDGYSQLMSLWMSYRERFPKLDRYLLKWSFDFTQVYQLKYMLPEVQGLPLYANSLICNVLISRRKKETPLKLPFPLICSLCDYSIVGSKFYKDGHQQLMQEAIPRVIALADAVLLKKTQCGLLDTYGPKFPGKKVYHVFQGAVCPKQNEGIVISVKDYTASAALREYIKQLVRYSENVLRDSYGYRGRLRGVELESELSNQVKSFLKKEYTPKENTEKAPPKRVEVKLDFDSIASLRSQSDAVRDALEVADEGTQKELLTELPEVSAMFAALSRPAQKFLLSLKATGWEIYANTEASTFVEEINSAAARFIARALIVTEAGRYIVEDDYRDELDYIYENTPESELAAQQETAAETEMRDAKLDGLDGIGLPEELKQFLEALTDIQRQALQAILFSDDPQEKLTQLAEEAMSMPEILVDEINDAATQFLDDILIDTFDDTPTVLEQYADELKRAVELLGVE